MHTDRPHISAFTFATALSAIVLFELIAVKIDLFLSFNRWFLLGLIRCLEALTIILMVRSAPCGLAAIGLSADRWRRGIVRGAIWAGACGCLTIILSGLGQWFGIFSISNFKTALPGTASNRVLFFVVGGLVAPVAEEVFFRGLLYTFLRRWGWPIALAVSTVLFVGSHASYGAPVTQLIGGLVFAVAYEIEKNLMVPIIIHSTGNLAIFSLSLL